MPVEMIQTKRLFQQVFEQLAELIGKGEFPLGKRLPAERDLARQLGVSRATVREAMIALELSGLVEVRVGSGVFVIAERPATPSRYRNRTSAWGLSNSSKPAAWWRVRSLTLPHSRLRTATWKRWRPHCA